MPSMNIKQNQSKVSFSIDKTELRKKEEERKELKYSSLFTNKTDKAIFSFNIKLTDSENNIIRSTMHIIDLAGSERITKSQKSKKCQKNGFQIAKISHFYFFAI